MVEVGALTPRKGCVTTGKICRAVHLGPGFPPRGLCAVGWNPRRSPSPRARPIRRCSRARTGGRAACRPRRIVRHVLSVTHGGDWPVQRDALDAVLRRCASAHTDEIQIVGRPRGRLLGLYATRRRGSRARPYRTLLRRIEPLDGSCECADFLRNSLGLCKHLVAVLERRRSRSGVASMSSASRLPSRRRCAGIRSVR